MITIYRKDNGKPVNIDHLIDAKEAVAGGFYTFTAPAPEKKVLKPIVKKAEPKLIVKKAEPKPIPKVESKPIVKAEVTKSLKRPRK